MKFTDTLDKLKIKLFAPATVVYTFINQSKAEFLYCSWQPACFVFADEPLDDKGYYKSIYVNGKRIKKWHIIPRHAFIEVRRKPKGIFETIGAIIVGAILGSSAVATTSTTTLIIVGVAASVLAVGAVAGIAISAFGIFGASGAKTGGGQTGTPTYSSNDNPSLTGSKNEALTKQVPIVIGRTFQVFNYAQYATPFVRSGYAGNRFRVYCIPTYKNVNFYNFKLGDISLSNYKSSSYSLSEAHGVSNFIGWDNAQTERFNNKELSFDNTQAIVSTAIAYYNSAIPSAQSPSANLVITQTYYFNNVVYSSWSNKVMNVAAVFIADGIQYDLTQKIIITKANITPVSGSTTNAYRATKTITFDVSSYVISEYLRTATEPDSTTRTSDEPNLTCFLDDESVKINSVDYSPVDYIRQSVDSYNGDRIELLSQSPTRSKYGDIHFSFPQGLYKVDQNTGARIRTTIQAEITWKRVGETAWRGVNDSGIAQLYVRNIDGEIVPQQSSTVLSSRIKRKGNIFTFKTPDDINYANNNFFECVGLEFAEEGQYIINVQPIVFERDNYYTGIICVSDVVWRLNPTINVVDLKMLPSVSQIACTFNATTQLEGDVDELGCVSFAKVKNLETGNIEESRNPVDIIYYLLTDKDSNPNPMTDDQIDMPSFLKARQWCASHECKTDGIINEEIKYSAVLEEITNNNQLYLIPNKWGKVVLRVDTNEDSRPIKTLFNADNSWDLTISRMRGRLGRTMALRCSYIDEETWSEKEITGYWYDGACHWQPEEGKDDLYYQPEKRDLNYVRNAESVKRRIAYELEIANEKNTLAEFSIAREVLDLEVLDRVLVADYTRIKDGVSGTIDDILKDNQGNIIGVKTSQPFVVKPNMTITIRSVDLSGEGQNVNIYNLVENGAKSSSIMFETPIPADENILRKSGFYTVDGQEFYYSGDLYMAGTAEILNMVIKSIEEVKGDDFTSKITCRLY